MFFETPVPAPVELKSPRRESGGGFSFLSSSRFQKKNNLCYLESMEAISDFSDSRPKGWCIHCGLVLSKGNSSSDHVPSKFFLKKPYPTNLFTTKICEDCNLSFSNDEDYFSRILRLIRLGKIEPSKPVELDRIKNVLVKNARGHIMYEHGEPVEGTPTSVDAVPIQYLTEESYKRFEEIDYGTGWPEVGSRLMDRLITGRDMRSDGWIELQRDTYRYAAMCHGNFIVRIVVEEYLAAEVVWSS